jgi:hypothetical protein
MNFTPLQPYSINYKTDGVEVGVISGMNLNIPMIISTAEISVSKFWVGVRA